MTFPRFALLPGQAALDAARSANVKPGNDHGKPKQPTPAHAHRGRRPLGNQTKFNLKGPVY